MTRADRNERRVGWLDGLRGIAAMQVVLLHYACAFLPGIGFSEPRLAHYSWEQVFIRTPLGFLFDGTSAVLLFFIMSGMALTHAFSAAPLRLQAEVMRRLVRLGLPMAAGVLLGAILLSVLPDAHSVAAEQSGSPVLLDIGPREISIATIIHQIAFEGLLTGFSGLSLLPDWVTGAMNLVPRAQGLDSPLWTLHVEFYGSFVVLALVALRKSSSRTLYHSTCVILGLSNLFAPNMLNLFVFGHVAAHWLKQMEGRPLHPALGAALLTIGVLLCCTDRTGAVATFGEPPGSPPPGLSDDRQTLLKMLGTVLIFSGVVSLPYLQRCLERPAMRWLGKISFSLYLSHFPLLATCGAAGFTLLNGKLPYGASAGVTMVAGIAASLAFAVPFERWIDRPSILLSRMIARMSRNVLTPVRAVKSA